MDSLKWNSSLAQLPNPHVLQTWEWGYVKSLYGWQPIYLIWCENQQGYHLVSTEATEMDAPVAAMALVLERTLTLRGWPTYLRVHYAPKGPLLRDWKDESLRSCVLEDLARLARARRAIFVKVDPDVRLGFGMPEQTGLLEDDTAREVMAHLTASHWRYSAEQVQFANTVMIDLTPDEAELLARMRQKTRYNVHLAQRKGVKVREGGLADLELLYQMYLETSVRDRFVIRAQDYYTNLWSTFIRAGLAKPLIAEVNGEAVAALILFIFRQRSWFLFGMSRNVHRERMPNYLLQWEAMRLSKEAGCQTYDLWGAPYRFDESDPLWGVYRFKEGFGGQVVRHIGAWDLPVTPSAYRIYTRFLPQVLALMRSRRMKKAEIDLSAGL